LKRSGVVTGLYFARGQSRRAIFPLTLGFSAAFVCAGPDDDKKNKSDKLRISFNRIS